MAYTVSHTNIFNQKIKKNTSKTNIPHDAYDVLNNIFESEYNIFLEHIRAMYFGIKEKCPDVLIESGNDLFDDIDNVFMIIDSGVDSSFASKVKNINVKFDIIDHNIKYLKEAMGRIVRPFTVEGYKYTIDDIPNMKYIDEYINGVRDVLYKPVDVSKVYGFRDKILNDEYINKFKAKLIGVKYPMSDSTYSEIVIARLRNNKTEPESIQVNNSYLEDMIKDIPVLHEKLKRMAKEKTEIKNKIMKYRKLFKSGKTSLFNEKYTDTNDLAALNVYAQARCREATMVCNAVMTVYVEKLDAINEELEFYDYIIKVVLHNDSKNREV